MRKPLAKVVYNLLSDKELKKKLTEVGLPLNGDRKVTSNVHTSFCRLMEVIFMIMNLNVQNQSLIFWLDVNASVAAARYKGYIDQMDLV